MKVCEGWEREYENVTLSLSLSLQLKLSFPNEKFPDLKLKKDDPLIGLVNPRVILVYSNMYKY